MGDEHTNTEEEKSLQQFVSVLSVLAAGSYQIRSKEVSVLSANEFHFNPEKGCSSALWRARNSFFNTFKIS